jgi:hypothetical protein
MARLDQWYGMRHTGRCKGPYVDLPPIGSVGPDLKANCTMCGKRVRVTVRGLFSHHKASKPVKPPTPTTDRKDR